MRSFTPSEIDLFLDMHDCPDILVTCPECSDHVRLRDFKQTEAPCEMCGSHYAVRCPSCEEVFDCILSNAIFNEVVPEILVDDELDYLRRDALEDTY